MSVLIDGPVLCGIYLAGIESMWSCWSVTFSCYFDGWVKNRDGGQLCMMPVEGEGARPWIYRARLFMGFGSERQEDRSGFHRRRRLRR